MATGPNSYSPDSDHFNYKHGMCFTPEYYSWTSMKSRCNNENDPSYEYYGGRGITVCEEWGDFIKFYGDMGTRPEGTSIDRIDVDKGYYKDNCRWADMSQQNSNKRPQMSRHKRNTSGIVGVTYKKDRDVWRARHRNTLIYSGSSKEEAIKSLEGYHANR